MAHDYGDIGASVFHYTIVFQRDLTMPSGRMISISQFDLYGVLFINEGREHQSKATD